jgi:hypothetical protein
MMDSTFHVGSSLVLACALLTVGCGRSGPASPGDSARHGAASSTTRPTQPPVAAPSAGIPPTDKVVGQQLSDRAEVIRQGGRLEVKLNFSGQPMTDGDLAAVPLNDAVTEIDLSRTLVTDEGLVHLKRAQNLTSINLDDTKVTDKGLEHLHELPKLQWVELMGNPQISVEAYDKLQKILQPRRPNP